MKKIVVFVLGPDRTGIIAAVTKSLYAQGCNLEDVSQTILQTEFLGIFVASMNDTQNEDAVLAALQKEVSSMELFVHLRPMSACTFQQSAGEPFIITTVGPDRPGLVAGITEVLAQNGVNITDLKAVSRGDGENQHYIMIYEIDVPPATDYHVLRIALHDRARTLGLDINLQHREIFEQIHRV